MRHLLLLLPVLLLLAAACGEPAAESPGGAKGPSSGDAAAIAAVYDAFARAARAGEWEKWAQHLDPDIRELTALQMARWLREKAPASVVSVSAKLLVSRYGLDGGALPDVIGGLDDPAAFLGEAVPFVILGQDPEKRPAFVRTIVPIDGDLVGIAVTGNSAHARAQLGAWSRDVVFHRVDGVWKVMSF